MSKNKLISGLMLVCSAGFADTISFSITGTGTAAGNVVANAALTATATWDTAKNLKNNILFSPTAGTVTVTGLKLVSFNNALGAFGLLGMTYDTSAASIVFTSNGGSYVATGAFSDPTTTINFNTPGFVACGPSKTCSGAFTGLGGDVFYSSLSAALTTALQSPAVPPGIATGQFVLGWNGSVTTDRFGNPTNFKASTTKATDFTGSSIFTASAVPEPSSLSLGVFGVCAVAFGMVRRRKPRV